MNSFVSRGRVVGAMMATAALALCVTTPAEARRVVIDSNPLASFTPCAIDGSACAGLPMFSIDVGETALANRVFVYANGLVSVGAPLQLPAGAITSLADFGAQDMFTAGYSLTSTAADFVVASGTANAVFFNGLLRVNYTLNGPNGATPVQFNFFQRTDGPAGSFSLYLAQGADGLTPPSTTLSPDTLIGVHFARPPTAFTNSNVDDENSFQFDFFATAAPGVPEPGSWALMIAGFGGIGAAMRRRRRFAATLA